MINSFRSITTKAKNKNKPAAIYKLRDMTITKDDLDVDYLSRTIEKFQGAEETEYEIVQSINGGDGGDPEVDAGGLGDMLVLDSR